VEADCDAADKAVDGRHGVDAGGVGDDDLRLDNSGANPTTS
jgi:hypothetical protein